MSLRDLFILHRTAFVRALYYDFSVIIYPEVLCPQKQPIDMPESDPVLRNRFRQFRMFPELPHPVQSPCFINRSLFIKVSLLSSRSLIVSMRMLTGEQISKGLETGLEDIRTLFHGL